MNISCGVKQGNVRILFFVHPLISLAYLGMGTIEQVLMVLWNSMMRDSKTK